VTAAPSPPAVLAPPLLEVRGLVKHFAGSGGLLGRRPPPVRAVDGVDLDVAPGEALGLVGESGCGKTTVGRTVLRLVEPTAGSALYRRSPGAAPVDLLGLSQRALRPLRRELQIVFQDPYASLDPRMQVGEIVGEALHAHRIARGAELEDRVVRALRLVGLSADARRRFPHEFSGGQRQRIAIARALVLEPRFVVCDEALSALDVSIQAQIANLLADLRAELGLSYLFVSHDLSIVRHLCERVAVMYLGRIVETGPTREVFEAPAHPYTRALLAAVPRPDPTRRDRPAPLRGEPPSASRPPSGCRFHPRCPVAEERCRTVDPAPVGAGPRRSAACLLLEPAPPGGGAA